MVIHTYLQWRLLVPGNFLSQAQLTWPTTDMINNFEHYFTWIFIPHILDFIGSSRCDFLKQLHEITMNVDRCIIL